MIGVRPPALRRSWGGRHGLFKPRERSCYPQLRMFHRINESVGLGMHPASPYLRRIQVAPLRVRLRRTEMRLSYRPYGPVKSFSISALRLIPKPAHDRVGQPGVSKTPGCLPRFRASANREEPYFGLAGEWRRWPLKIELCLTQSVSALKPRGAEEVYVEPDGVKAWRLTKSAGCPASCSHQQRCRGCGHRIRQPFWPQAVRGCVR